MRMDVLGMLGATGIQFSVGEAESGRSPQLRSDYVAPSIVDSR
jgi:hypothetical protein